MIDEDNTDKGYYINGTFLACSPLDVADQTKSLVTLTDTVTSYKYSTIIETSAYAVGRVRRQAAATPEPLRPLNLPSGELVAACSCYVAYPPGQTTKTATTVITKRETATITKTTTSFTTRRFTTTSTVLDVQGVYTYVTEYPDSTLTITVTSCSGINPTPSFDLQVFDTTPTRTDSYNLLYPTPTQNAGFGPEFYTLDYLPNAPPPIVGGIFNVDCLGRLIVEKPGGGPPLFGAVSYFQPGFELVYFLEQGEIVKRSYSYISCTVGPTVSCSVPQSPPMAPLTMFLTCPLYDEYFDTPLIISNAQSTDAPVCYGLQFRVATGV